MRLPTVEELSQFFHSLVIPFLGGFAVTLGKIMADRKTLDFDESNNIALDLVLIAIGAVAELHREKAMSATVIFDAVLGDFVIIFILLYRRYIRMNRTIAAGKPEPVGWFAGTLELVLGMSALIWTINPV